MNRLLYLLTLAIVLGGLLGIGIHGNAIFSGATVPVPVDEILKLNPD